MIYPDKSYFIGNYQNDKKSGLGLRKFINQKVFKGNFINDEPNGYGELIYPDGTTIKGMFKNGHLSK